MQAFLAVVTALFWGAGNFSMGIASKRHSPRAAVLAGFLAGLLGATVYLAVSSPEIHRNAFLWGVCSGFAQGAGWGILSYAMHIGRVSIVAPIAAAGTSACVFLAGLLSGDAAGFFSVIGAIAVLVSIALLTAGSDPEVTSVVGPLQRTSQRRAPLLAVVVALCFAVQALCLKHVDNEEPSTVMFGARLAVVFLIGVSLFLRPVRVDRERRLLLPAILGGLILLVGDIVYLGALRHGPLSVAGVLAGANPAVTVVLAAVILSERLRSYQLLGVVLALFGSALLALG